MFSRKSTSSFLFRISISITRSRETGRKSLIETEKSILRWCRWWWRWSFEIEIEIALNLKDESVRMITVHRGLRESRFEGMRIPNEGLQRALTIILRFKIDFEIERENHRNINFEIEIERELRNQNQNRNCIILRRISERWIDPLRGFRERERVNERLKETRASEGWHFREREGTFVGAFECLKRCRFIF